MNARPLLYSPNLHPLYTSNRPPETSPRNRRTLKPDPKSLRVWIHQRNRSTVFRVLVRSSDERESSNSYAETIKEGREIVNGNGVVSDSLSSVPWWEEFPKRWVIVLLCFSAFLLCNMDRVSFPSVEFKKDLLKLGFLGVANFGQMMFLTGEHEHSNTSHVG